MPGTLEPEPLSVLYMFGSSLTVAPGLSVAESGDTHRTGRSAGQSSDYPIIYLTTSSTTTLLGGHVLEYPDPRTSGYRGRKVQSLHPVKLTWSGYIPQDGSTSLQEGVEATSTEEPALMLHNIMAAIQGVQTSLEGRIDSVTTEMTLIDADLLNIRVRVKEAKDYTPSLQASTEALMAQINDLRATTKAMEARLEEYENLLWRNNLCIIGVPE
ncbi:hypothetical protein NDU88_000989 [Pleurodeles waltl]|uniref:Uncharacterized protein n=1 Tax=Pleurodeles waltl TaxID=8319 RepID=A0AAV7S8I3_PLEWA|nr:hypothetical protein NDU88_000989 [Pleurodeles waltl]